MAMIGGWRRWRGLVGWLALTLGACSGGDDAPGVAAHPWINPPRARDEKSVILPAWLVYRVHPELRAEAEAELAAEPYLQISPGMARYYTRQDLRVPAEMRPFLIRALDAPGARLEIEQSLYGLWARTIGGDTRAVGAQPLVVLVDPTPADIFVTVEVAPAGR